MFLDGTLEDVKGLYIYVLGTRQCEEAFAESEWPLQDNIQLRFMPIQIDDALAGNGRVPFLALMKFDTPALIHHKKVLYIDSDVVVLQDISALFQLNMGIHAVGAVPNGDKEATTLRPYSQYGAGVLLFQVDMFRKQNAAKRLLEHVSEADNIGRNDKYIFNRCLQDDFFDLENALVN